MMSTKETPQSDWAPGLENAFSLPVHEGSYILEDIQGKIPSFVRGLHLLNGPGQFQVGHVHYRHWLDGDGMVTSMRFEESEVHFASRLIRTDKLEKEEAAGEALFRTFGTSFPSDQLFRGFGLASPVNVSAYNFAGNLLAFGEQSLPYRLDSRTLETLGEYDFDRQINCATPFSGHPKFDPDTGEMVNFGVAYSASQPRINLYRFDRSGHLVLRSPIALDHPRSMHDFALGPHHVVFYLNAHVLDMGKLLRDGATMQEALEWVPEIGTFLLIVSRETGEVTAKIAVDTAYCLHTINVFEEGPRLVIDVIELERPVYDQYEVLPDILSEAPHGSPVRYVVDLESKRIVSRRPIPYDLAAEFPHLDPAHRTHPYEHFWMLGMSATGQPGRKCFDQLVHARWDDPSLDIFPAPEGSYFGGEPAFVPDPSGETGGAIICNLFDAQQVRSECVLFDARAVAEGPIARLPLRSPVRLGFHSSFFPD